jgi:uncharacterized protein involved in exopolysaccharide biosynthesis
MNPTTAEQPISVPRRMMDVGDYLDAVRRHRAWILGPLLAGIVVGVVTAYLWPDSYVTSGIIRVVPSQVSQRIVESSVSDELAQRLSAIYQTVIQRNNLINLIQTYNLYPDDRKKFPMEDVVETMRKDIKMGRVQTAAALTTAVRSGFAFTLEFTYRDRKLVEKVCSDLISSFVNESVRVRSSQFTQTNEFVREQLDQTRKELKDIDTRIMQFRMKNFGESPEQEQALNMRITTLETTTSNLNNNVSRVQQEKLQLESSLRTLQDQWTAMQAPIVVEQPVQQQKNERLAALEKDITQLQQTLVALRERYRDDHPDVLRAQQFLNSRLKERDQIQSEIASAKPEQAPRPRVVAPNLTTPEARRLQADLSRARSLIQAKDMELEDLARQIKETRQKITSYMAQLETSPMAQQQYNDLVRERDLAQKRYQDMMSKYDVTERASELENRKQGETLEVLDRPITPQDPTKPNRPLFISAGVVLGLLVGIMLAAFREMKDTSLKNLKDVRAYTKLSVLASIPLLENDFVVRRRRRLAWLGWGAACMMSALLVTGSIIYYYTSKT